MKNSVVRIHLFAALAIMLLSGAALAQNNTSFGTGALASVTTGHDDSAFGFNPLHADTTGSSNTAIGSGALEKNIGLLQYGHGSVSAC